MKKTFKSYIFLTILIFSSLNIISCGNHNDTASCFPSSPISVNLNLNLALYNNLNYTGGWIYIHEQQSGTRGLIAVRGSGNNFKIYDRNAPHLCPDSNTTLEVKDNIYILCPKDNTKWMLLTGSPTDGAATGLPPKTYQYNFDASTNTLNIYY